MRGTVVGLMLGVVLFTTQCLGQGYFTFKLSRSTFLDGAFRDSIIVGRWPGASVCVDLGRTFSYMGQPIVEAELPPLGPGFEFRSTPYAAWNTLCAGATEWVQGLQFDVRGLSGSRTQLDTFRIQLQRDAGAPASDTIRWDTGLATFVDSAFVRHELLATTRYANLITQQQWRDSLPSNPHRFLLMFYGAPGVTLSLPACGTAASSNPSLEWLARPSATKYRVQVATDSLFVSMIVNDSSVAGTSRTIGPLTNGQTYYWRVSAGNNLGWGVFSGVCSFIVANIPSAPVLVFPADAQTGIGTSLVLRWNVSTGTTNYHAQLATDSNFVTGFVVNDSSLVDTTRAVSGLNSSTTYFWRVRAKNSLGSSSFSPRRRFTTLNLPPVAPTLVAPANGAQNQPTAVTFSWNGVNGAQFYRLQVDTSSSFVGSGVFNDSLITATSRAVSGLQNNRQYFWRVNARNDGGTGPFSEVRNFTTVPPAPSAPALNSPANNATNVATSPLLSWSSVATATTYHVQLARDSVFSTLVDSATVSTTSRQVPAVLLSNTLHFWRVQASNAGGSSSFSTIFRFTTTAAPPAPLRIAPIDSATIVPRSPTFVWNRVPGAIRYHLQVAADTGFTSLQYNDTTITDSARQAGPFPASARLYWRLRVRNSVGWSAFTDRWTFQVMMDAPAATTLLAPANLASNVAVTPTMRWRSAALARWYHLQIAYDTLMTSIAYENTAATDTFFVARVEPSRAYYWRVRAKNLEGTYGSFTTVWKFTTCSNCAPAVPIPTAPANGDTNVPMMATLRWITSPGATMYQTQISRNNLFTQIVFDDSTSGDAIVVQPNLQAFTQHYWRVRARVVPGNPSAYSVVQQFRTSGVVGVDDRPSSVPSEYALAQNYPNPFNPSTVIRYSLSVSSWTILKVYNTLAQEVATLVEGYIGAGSHEVVFDAGSLPSGVYVVRMIATGSNAEPVFRASRKLMFIK